MVDLLRSCKVPSGIRWSVLETLAAALVSLACVALSADDIPEDEQVLRELGLIEEASDITHGEQQSPKRHIPHRHVLGIGKEDQEKKQVENPWDLLDSSDDGTEYEGDGDEDFDFDYEDHTQSGKRETSSIKNGQRESFVQSLEEEYMELRGKHKSNFFEGAKEYLERIILHKRAGADAAGAQSVLGFHFIKDHDYERCAVTFEAVDEVMNENTPGPGLLAEYCHRMAADPKSLQNLERAMPLLRSAKASAKKDLEEERVKVLDEHIAQLARRLQDARGHTDFGASRQNVVQWYVEGLEARPFHDRARFPGALLLEENFASIKNEVDTFLQGPAVSSEMRPMGEHTGGADSMLTLTGEWTDVSLFKGGVRNKHVCTMYFPKTCGLIERQLPEAWSNNFCQVVVSQLTPGTETMPHRGGTNAQLTLHLGLKTPPSAGLTVAHETLQPGWHEGKVIVFDDSFEHQVWHRGEDSEGARVVLVVRIWHPSFSLRERLDVVREDAFKMGSREVRKRSRHLQSAEAVHRFDKSLAAFRGAQIGSTSNAKIADRTDL